MPSGSRTILQFAMVLCLVLGCGPSDPLEEIRQSQEAGRFQDSIGALRQLLDENPDQPEAQLLLGRALLQTGNAGLAVWPLRKATEAPEYTVEAGLLLTGAMLESRSSHHAVEEIDRVLAIEPDNLEALLLRVDANRAEGNTEEALADIDRVLEREPGNPVALVSRVTALISLDRIDEAGDALDAAQANFDASTADLAKPMLARLCVARALFTFQNDDHETAAKHYADCAERYPTYQVAVTEIMAYYDRIGQGERATEVLRRAAEESQSTLFVTMLSRRMGALGRTEEEEKLLRDEAERLNTTIGWFILADYYVQRDRFDEALVAFEHSLEGDSPSPRLRFAYADTLVQAGRFDEARDEARRLQHPEFRNLIQGRILLGEGKPREALAALEAGIRLWPNNAVARFLAGQAAERAGDYVKATSHYRESFRTSPGDSEAGRALAEIYAIQGLKEDALQIASRYIRARSADPEAYLLSARLAYATGRDQVATEGLKRLRTLPGQAPVAAAEEASHLASEGSEESAAQAVEALESAELDWTDAANAIAFRILVEQLGALERHDEAAARVAEALAAHPDEAIFHEIEGQALRAAAMADRARASYERAVELDEQNSRALAALAALAADSGDRTGALGFYDRAIAADPGDPAPALAAIALVRETDVDETVRRLEQLLDRHPREAAAANELAELFADRGALGRARAYANRAAWFALPEAKDTVARLEKLRAEAGTEPGASSGAEPEAEPTS